MKRIFFVLVLALVFSLGEGQIVKITHTYYTIYFDTVRKLPLYTYYKLTKAHLPNNTPRTSFTHDPLADLSVQTNVDHYQLGTGPMEKRIDAGHLSPDDDFRFKQVAEKDAMRWTNVAPQNYNLNRGAWGNIEDSVKNICAASGTVKVWTGCIYYNTLAVNGVPKPHYYWKVIKYNGGKIEWLAENIHKPGRTCHELIVADGEIEQRTGLVFQ